MGGPSSIRTLLRRSAALTAGVAIAAAGLLASAAPAEAAATTAVRGTVTLDGRPLAGVPVGTWRQGHGVLATATTDSAGRFVLRSPRGVAVEAFAGSKPSASKAVFADGDDRLVRGVIGRGAPAHLAAALAQRVTPASPSRLGGGRALRFRLQRAARFTAASPLLGRTADATGVIDIERGDGAYGTEFAADDTGAVTSGWLVPGRYHLYWAPSSPYLPARTWATLPSGATTTLTAPDFRRGTRVELHVTSGGAPVGAGVPVVQLVGGEEQSAPSTDSSGTAVEEGVAPGTYRFRIGQYFDDPDEGLEGPPSTDAYLTADVSVVVAAGATTASATVDLAPAGAVSGTVTGVPSTHSVLLYAEDADGLVVRSGDAASGSGGAFTLGGLPTGTYTVFAVDTDAHEYAAESVALTAGSTASAGALTPHTAEPTVHGTVAHARSGTVALEAPRVHGAILYTTFGGSIGRTGRYRVRTIPGRFLAVVTANDRVTRTSGTVRYSRSTVRDQKAGPRYASATARFRVGVHPVAVDLQTRGPGGVLLELDPVKPVGRSTGELATPGSYSAVRVFGTPATDGPWYYATPSIRFTLHAGKRTDLGVRHLRIVG